VISPLLANRYMNRFLRHWRNQGRGEAFRAHVVNYADDFVILSRGHAVEDDEVLALAADGSRQVAQAEAHRQAASR
jgi:ABC-type Na+ transport system ATPase subunit NatA